MPSAPTNLAFSTVNGIEVREYYAAQALAGMLANDSIMTIRIAHQTHREMIAAVAFLIADEMIAASALATPVLQANVDKADLGRNG